MTFAERMERAGVQGADLQVVCAGTTKHIQEVALHLLHPKANHTFVVRENTDAFRELYGSIEKNGIQTPLLVRHHTTIPGHYEIISGHTRYRVAELLKLEKVPIYAQTMGDDEADILMAESNFQRPDWLPSEKAHTYKVWLEATERKS